MGDGDAGQKKWFETIDFGPEDTRTRLINAGFHSSESIEQALEKAVNANHAAEQRLGVKPDQLLKLPGEGDDVAAWRKEHAKALGIPDTKDGYD